MELNKGDLYLGRETAGDGPVIYAADDLTTHGVIVGMTGSGKTGLGIDLIEEALLNGISCLVIDPKGDMGNLALNFPNLKPEDFQPWVDAATAAKEGKTMEELAAATAEMWTSGLAGHDIAPERMRRLADGADITIYTPGSSAGVGLNVLGSLAVPDLDWDTDSEVIRDEIGSLVSSLLVLAGVESDPVAGQEHILLATIIEHLWKDGRDLDLATLVGQIPKPPFRKMGVFDVDTFFPEKDRMALALRLNGLLASPSFATWMEGRPLDIEAMIGGDRPQAAIVYMSHLTDEERQFLVTLLLGKMVTWIRAQPGTSELRALVYMDEVFGFAPPTKEPPSKKPILTIFKQARAHGVGMILSTQNPVDLDYKAMSNAGTWMVGRLQTENDKKRILEALASASGDIDIDLVDKQISDLDKRQFVLHSTKESGPRLFSTRWAMSYLAGPLTRDQVTELMSGLRQERVPDPTTATDPSDVEPVAPTEEAPAAADESVPVAPEVASGVPVSYLDPSAPWASEVGADPTGRVFAAGAVATVQLTYDDTKAGINHSETYETVIFPLDGIVDVGDVITADHDDRDFVAEAPAGATYRATDVALANKTFWSGVGADLINHLVANRPLVAWRNAELGLYSRVDETEDQFRQRCVQASEEGANAEMAKLKEKYATRIDRVRDQLATAQARSQEAEAVATAKNQETILGTAGDLLGAFLGGRSGSTALSKAAGRRTASARASAKAETEQAKLAAKTVELEELEADLATEITEIASRYRDLADQIEQFEIPLEKTDARIAALRLVWVPVA
jgi:hypothetical protein